MVIEIEENLNINIPNDTIKVLVVGDLNIDIIFQDISIGKNSLIKPVKSIGGTGINASIAFKQENFTPILWGKIGDDYYGKIILNKLNSLNIISILESDNKKPTGLCNIFYFNNDDHYRTIFYDNFNSNDYDIENFLKALEIVNLKKSDFVFLSLYIIPQVDFNIEYCTGFFNILKKTQANIIIDLVPHNLYDYCTIDDLKFINEIPVFALIGEYRTFLKLINVDNVIGEADIPNDSAYLTIAKNFKSKYYLCRYGKGNISYQTVYSLNDNHKINYIEYNSNTEYLSVSPSEKRGFGDILTAKTLKKIIKSDNIFQKFLT